MKQKKFSKNGVVLFFYIAVVFIFNWSILCGKNLMKWDIMDAYYPLCMSSADMLQSGRLPLWNAAFQFGSPTYVMLGIPYWYPTTILFELTTGYSLRCVALDYCIHVILACYGMFLLAKSHLEGLGKQNYVIAAIAGGFYGFSGLFISNAEHIMIIISAAWLPYILFFVKNYFESHRKIILIAATLCMGLSILGGYPEVWIATLIILIPYFLIHTNVEGKIAIKILKTAFIYTMFVTGTVVSAAISIIPFIMSSKYIDRLNGGATVNSYSVKMALSSILPHYERFCGDLGVTLDISMISMFMGLLTILLVGASLFTKIKYKWKYLGLSCFAFLMMLGNNSFLHPLFYKYFPLFSSLRFPSTWRCVLTVFVLLLAVQALKQIVENEDSMKKVIMVCLIVCVLFGGLYYLAPHIWNSMSDEVIAGIRSDMGINFCVCFLYALSFMTIFFMRKKKSIDITWLLIVGVFVDIFAGQCFLYPMTVMRFNQWNVSAIRSNQDEMKVIFEKDKNRIHSIEYNDAKRTKSGLNSTEIVYGHTLDEEGYLSVLLNYVQAYKKSEHCRSAVGMPEAYITNDVVSKEDVDYGEWIQDTSVSPYQIYVEHKVSDMDVDQPLGEGIVAEHFISGDISFDISQDTDGYLVVQQSFYPGWNVYVDGKKGDIVQINRTFLGVNLSEGEHTVHFIFRPLDFYIGATISLGYLVFFIIYFVLYLRKKKEIF